ncbi:MAG: phage tail assembly protein [Reyranella sp.]|nr:phage tail assembly protein [Reyranella sp.]
MGETYSHTLAHPITVTLKGPAGERTETITQLDFEFPAVLKARHLRATDGHAGEIGKTLALLAQFCGQPVKVLDELSGADLAALSEKLESFQ